MEPIKTKAIEALEEKMAGIDNTDIRHIILENAKGFKTSWINLGQALYTAWKDKLYKNWGYDKFDTYTSKEIGIRKQTALKLLRSYYFLEKEDPLYLKKEYNKEADTATVPTYDSVNVLRLAKNRKDIDREDYANIKKNILEKGKDAPSARKDLTALIRQREELQPQEAWEKKKTALLKRLLSTLISLRVEAKATKMISIQTLKDTDKLITQLESEMLQQENRLRR
ncbi:MAG: hypothetical protein ABH843_04000 [Candidatus Omnitrophota bacterium]